MRKRYVQKIIRFSPEEAYDFERKARMCKLSESALIRSLLSGYEPRQCPDSRFYDAMREISAIGNNINQLAVKANSLGFIDSRELKKEADRWHIFQAYIERNFLCPEKKEMNWQLDKQERE